MHDNPNYFSIIYKIDPPLIQIKHNDTSSTHSPLSAVSVSRTLYTISLNVRPHLFVGLFDFLVDKTFKRISLVVFYIMTEMKKEIQEIAHYIGHVLLGDNDLGNKF